MVCTVVCRYLAQIGFQRGIHNIQQSASSTSMFIARYTLLIAVGIQHKQVCSEVYTAYSSRHLAQVGLQRGIHSLQSAPSSTLSALVIVKTTLRYRSVLTLLMRRSILVVIFASFSRVAKGDGGNFHLSNRISPTSKPRVVSLGVGGSGGFVSLWVH